jgi:hypothetical protein
MTTMTEACTHTHIRHTDLCEACLQTLCDRCRVQSVHYLGADGIVATVTCAGCVGWTPAAVPEVDADDDYADDEPVWDGAEAAGWQAEGF